MTQGKLIAFEGGEGSGKSTQARKLAERLAAEGIEVVITREPGGTPGAEAIRTLLLDPPPGAGWGAKAEALLFAAARADHVTRFIRPALQAGRWVVCDRFIDSSRAYQGVAGALGDDVIRQLHEFGSDGLLPDLTILLDVDDAVSAGRLQQRDGDRSDAIGGRGRVYHDAVNQAFRDFAIAEAPRFALVPGGGTVEDVQARVWDAVTSLLSANGS